MATKAAPKVDERISSLFTEVKEEIDTETIDKRLEEIRARMEFCYKHKTVAEELVEKFSKEIDKMLAITDIAKFDMNELNE